MNISVARLTLIPTCCTTRDLGVINVKYCRHVLGQKVLIRTAYRWREYWVWAKHKGRHPYQVHCFKGKRWNDANTVLSDKHLLLPSYNPESLHAYENIYLPQHSHTHTHTSALQLLKTPEVQHPVRTLFSTRIYDTTLKYNVNVRWKTKCTSSALNAT